MGYPTVFTMSTANVDKVLASTMSVYSKELSDQIFTGIPFFHYIYKKNKKSYQGGISIVIPVNYKKNNTVQSYSRYDTLSVTPQETVTSIQYKWKTYAASVSISGTDLAINQGDKTRIINLIAQEIDNAKMAVQDKLGSDLFATTPGANDILSLPYIVDSSASIGDHDPATDTWWVSTVNSTSTSFAGAGLAGLRTMVNTLSKYNQKDKPDFHVTSQTNFEYYENLGQPQQRITTGEDMDLGFETLMFKGGKIFWDENCATAQWYVLNSSHLELVVMSGRDFSPSEWVKPANQDAKTMQLFFMGNLITNERRKLGKFTAITP